MIFHIESNYDYWFIIKQLVIEIMKKYKTFLVPIEKEINIFGKRGKLNQKSYPIKYNLLIE